MNGIFVAVLGVWVVTQVLAGEALQRLEIV